MESSVEFKVRPMEPRDLPAVLAIESVSFPTPWSYQAFASELRNRYGVYFVALAGERVVGYAGMWLFLGEAHVTTIAVHPDYRRRGLGRLLLGTLVRHAKEQGAETMILEVRPSNLAARRLYQEMGFRQIGVRRNYYLETREDALVMLKNLKEGDASGGRQGCCGPGGG